MLLAFKLISCTVQHWWYSFFCPKKFWPLFKNFCLVTLMLFFSWMNRVTPLQVWIFTIGFVWASKVVNLLWLNSNFNNGIFTDTFLWQPNPENWKNYKWITMRRLTTTMITKLLKICNRVPQKRVRTSMLVPKNGHSWQLVRCLLLQASRALALMRIWF